MNTTFAQQLYARSVVMPANVIVGSAPSARPGAAGVMTQPPRLAGAWRTAALAAVVAAALAGCSAGGSRTSTQEQNVSDPARPAVALVHLPAGQVSYYPPGDFTRQGQPANPGRVTARFEQGLAIMKHQVSQADYALCVADGACKPLARNHRDNVLPDHPVVGVSWQDANTFAAWLSEKTGQAYRLPTYQEWVFAAGSAYKEDVLLDAIDPDNPATYWLAEYELESQRKSAVDATVQPFGSFGVNEAGLQDMVGNVWDWTDTCHVRVYLDANGRAVNGEGSNCGIRVVAGPHRSYITDFIRDPKGGACSVGIPPSNLGFRLVRDDTASGLAAQAISNPGAGGKAVNAADAAPGKGMNRLRSLLGLG